MSTPTEGGPVNGHLTPRDASISAASSERALSDSPGPDTQSPPAVASSPSVAQDPTGDAFNDLHEHHDVLGSDGGSGHSDASDDVEFEMHDSVISPPDDGAVPDGASSIGSPRLPKRKTPVAEEDFIQANPELYGLRRSVREPDMSSPSRSRLTPALQTRARETRKLVRAFSVLDLGHNS